MRYKLTIEYDGTNLLGWQRQLDGPSAQQYLEEVLELLSGYHSEVAAAGITMVISVTVYGLCREAVSCTSAGGCDSLAVVI